MLLPLVFFEVMAGLDAEGARAACEDGTLWPAWNLATLTGEHHRLALHVWRGAVEQWQPGRISAPKGNLDDVIARVLPSPSLASGGPATVAVTELAFRWCCSAELIADLIRAGELRTFGKRAVPNATPRVLHSSVVDFLKRRIFQ
jgi:hypothetical protein